MRGTGFTPLNCRIRRGRSRGAFEEDEEGGREEKEVGAAVGEDKGVASMRAEANELSRGEELFDDEAEDEVVVVLR